MIKAVRALDPEIKIIVNSVEDNPVKIKELLDVYKIDGYVCKGRSSLNELIQAVKQASTGAVFVSPQIDLSEKRNVIELEELDLIVINDLAEGYSKREIRERLIKQGIKPNSESSLDNLVSKLFIQFDVKNSTHLVAKLARQGII